MNNLDELLSIRRIRLLLLEGLLERSPDEIRLMAHKLREANKWMTREAAYEALEAKLLRSNPNKEEW